MGVYRRYGNTDFPYGSSGRLYGNQNVKNLYWSIEVDWDDDGVFDGRNEAANAVGLTIKRGRDLFINVNDKGEANGFQRVTAGKAIITLDNASDDYNDWNTSSPLYPYVVPGKDVRIRVKNGTSGTFLSVFYGTVQKITPSLGTEPRTKLVCSGTLRFLADNDAKVSLTQNIVHSDAIGLVLDAVGWSSTWGRNIETSTDNIPFWWSDKRALTEINDLAEADLGVLFGAADGSVTFYGRNHVDSSPVSIDQSQCLKIIDVPQAYTSIRNLIRVYSHVREEQTQSTLWSMVESAFVYAGEERTFWAEYSYGNERVPATSVLQPVGGSEYFANTDASGTGTDLTSDFVVTDFYAFGETARITMKNNSSLDGYVTSLDVLGNAIAEISNSFFESSSGNADRLFTLDLAQLQNVDLSNNFAIFLNGMLGRRVVWPKITIEARPDLQFSFDLFSTILLTIDKYALSDERYQVGSIEHSSLDENLQSFRTVVQLEPSRELFYWKFPVQIGIDSIFGV